MRADPAAPSPARSGGRIRRALLASSVTLLGLLLAAEVGLRLAGDRRRTFESGLERSSPRWAALMRARVFQPVADDVRRYAMRPGAEVTVDGFEFRVNSRRARGAELAAEKPPGERRLLCLGDSFAFGLWCAEDETLIGELARLANAAEQAAGSGTRWQPVNLGVPGYHSGQQLRALVEDGLALAPDLVVLYYNANDINREGFFLDPEYGALRSDHLPLPVPLRKALWSSHVYGWAVHRLNRYWGRLDHGLDPRCPWSPLRADNRAATRAALAEIARLCRESAVPLFVVNQPLMTYSGDARDPGWRQLDNVLWARGVLAELRLPTLDLLGWLRGYADGVDRLAADGSGPPPDFHPDLYFSDPRFAPLAEKYRLGLPITPEELAFPDPDFHLDGAGYAHIARLAYSALRAEGWLP